MRNHTSTPRRALGVDMIVHRYADWSEIVATGPYTDRASIFDHTAFYRGADERRELNNALRRHARLVTRIRLSLDEEEFLRSDDERLISGVSRADVRAAIDTWDRAADGDSGDAEIDAAVDMRDMLEAMLNYDA